MPKKECINEKAERVRKKLALYENNREGMRTDTELYLLIYEILNHIIKCGVHKPKLDFQTLEDIRQNITQMFFERSLNKENPLEIVHIYTYLYRCVMAELSKLDLPQYLDRPYRAHRNIEESMLKNIEAEELNPTYDNACYRLLEMEGNCKLLINKIKRLLYECPANTTHKKLLLFPIIVCLSRNDTRILRMFPLRIRAIAKEILYEIGEPVEFLK